jgi:hypothetical protein
VSDKLLIEQTRTLKVPKPAQLIHVHTGATVLRIHSQSSRLRITPQETKLTIRQGLPGPPGPQGEQGEPGVDAQPLGFDFLQSNPATTWIITHNLGKYPVPAVTDSADTILHPQIRYIDMNELEVTFVGATAGKAHLV